MGRLQPDNRDWGLPFTGHGRGAWETRARTLPLPNQATHATVPITGSSATSAGIKLKVGLEIGLPREFAPQPEHVRDTVLGVELYVVGGARP